MKFTYCSGQRPLDGYTIKRGIGTGGFGEVYYALSDGGKEVALKFVRGSNEVELRGIVQCLNLKHPHLVSLFDLKTDEEGQSWVVMEYVAGETLGVVLNRHPQGLAPDLARQWFIALAKAIGYLHEHGIVHRDLKPANIFVENGVLKLGDYGLSKCISGTTRAAQTQSVGTVYYMAPEVSTGNYNKQIDIYAAGIILYEMLTGRVPFDGESAGEILMKHLTAPPDLSKVPAAYVPVLSKALAKNPAQRYATVGEMARAVESLGSVNPRPASPAPTVPPPSPHRPVAAKQEAAAPVLDVIPVIPMRVQLAELSTSLSVAGGLAALLALVFTALSRQHHIHDMDRQFQDVGSLFFLTVAICWSVLVPSKLWTSRATDSWGRRGLMLALGFGVALGGMWLKGWLPTTEAGAVAVLTSTPGNDSNDVLTLGAGYLSFFGIGLAALRWWKMVDRYRPQRFSWFPVLVVGLLGVVLGKLFLPESDSWIGTLALVVSSIIVQWVSPWQPPTPPASRKLRLRYA
jgi:serine/threonine protein kinase